MSAATIWITAIFTTIASAEMEVLVIADWGGQELPPFTTFAERSTAKRMNEVVSNSTVNASMVWALGDNFYVAGVLTSDSFRFEHVWSNVFDGPFIRNLPFYVVAGNHDHYGSVNAQIEYSHQNPHWIFPELWYSKTWNVPGTNYTLQLVMIDTIIGMNYMSPLYHLYIMVLINLIWWR